MEDQEIKELYLRHPLAAVREVNKQNATLRAKVTALENVLLSKHGGEPLVLLAELDTLREENDALEQLAAERLVSLKASDAAHGIVSEEIDTLRAKVAALEESRGFAEKLSASAQRSLGLSYKETKELKELLGTIKPYLNEWYESEALDEDDLESYQDHNANIRTLRAAIDAAREK